MSYDSETFRKITTYQCRKCLTTCNTLDNIGRHITKHPGQTNTQKTLMYEIKEISPEPNSQKQLQLQEHPSLQDHILTSQLAPMTTFISKH